MSFAETIATNPPRLVVLFRRGADGSEQFQWNVTGSIPILSLIGYISRVQSLLVNDGWMKECDAAGDAAAFVMTYNADDRSMNHFKHQDIPNDALAGMLETIKWTLVAGRMGQQAAAQRANILGPDGRPANGYKIGG